MSETTETLLAIRRVTVTSAHSFDDVVAAVYAGLARIGNFAAALADWRNAPDRESFDAAVQPLTGPSGLIEFLSLDHGAAVTVRYPDRGYRLLRIIAGNPVTMSTMTVTTPDAGSYAPVTILIAERPRGVTLSYDRVASAIAPYGNAEASAVAASLDDAVPLDFVDLRIHGIGNLSRESGLPEVTDKFGVRLSTHTGYHLGGCHGLCHRKPFEQSGQTEPVISVAMSDVDGRQTFSAGLDPIGEGFGLLLGQERVDE
jgi:uncharacterized protein (DUF302 family)